MATKTQNLIAGAFRNTKTSAKGNETHTYISVAYPEGKTPADFVHINPCVGHGKPSEAIMAAMDEWPEAGMDLDFMVEAYRTKITSHEYIEEHCKAHRAGILLTQDIRQYAARHKVSIERATEAVSKARKAEREAAKAAAAKAETAETGKVLDPK